MSLSVVSGRGNYKLFNSQRFRLFLWLPFLALPVISVNKAQSQTIDRYITIQPIQVCNDSGANCAITNFFEPETDKIWSQAGIDFAFLPLMQFNNTAFLTIDNYAEFTSLIDGSGHGQNSNSTTLNMWFLNTLPAAPKRITFGQARAIPANGVVIAGATFDYSRLDTIAHELGHDLGLCHNQTDAPSCNGQIGAGDALNLMTKGDDRTTPSSINDIVPDGGMTDQLTTAQNNIARSSVFTNEIPEVIVSTMGSTPFDTDDFFHIGFNNGSTGITLNTLTLNLSSVNAFFDPTNTPPGTDSSPFLTSSLNGLSSSDISVSGLFDGSQAITLNFLPGSFAAGDSFNFGVDIDLFSNIDGFGATPEELEGATFTFGFSDGYNVTSALDQFIASSHLPSTNSQFIGTPRGGGIIPQPFLEFSDPEQISVPEPSISLITWLGLGAVGLFQTRFKLKKTV
jgi:hypothetical protein